MHPTSKNKEAEFIAIRDQLESYLYRLSANREDAKDLMQDTYLKVKEKINSFQEKSTFKTWVFAIATNLAKDNQRVRNRWKLEVQDDCKQASLSKSEYQQRIRASFQSQTEQQFEMVEHINYCFTCIAKT